MTEITTGRTGLWRCAGEAGTATHAKDARDDERAATERTTLQMAMVGFCAKSPRPLSREELLAAVKGGVNATRKALEELVATNGLVEVWQRGSKSRYHLLWTADRASAAGLRPDAPSVATLVSFSPKDDRAESLKRSALTRKRSAAWARQVGRAMRSARIESGLTMLQVAQELPWRDAYQRVRQWEAGVRAPSLAALDAYARALGVTLREVLP